MPGAGLKRLTQQLKAVQADAGGRLIAEGTTIAGRFVVGELLGDGPFGQVYAAEDKEIEDKVALKVLRAEVLPTEKDRERYFSVTRGARTNTQRHVARLHESGEHDGLFWVSRQYLDGLSLRKVLKLQSSKGEVSSLDELERLITQLTHALQHIGPDHSHGDLKPENIFLMPDVLKVTDAYVMSALPPVVVAAQLASSPYLAPELRKSGGTLTPRCDVYSLGVILSEVAFGATTPPAAGSERGEREEIAALCRRAMSEAPTARPGSAEAFSEELGAILDAKRLGARRGRAATPAAAPPAPVPAPPAPPAEERRAVTPPAAPAVKADEAKAKPEAPPAPKPAEPAAKAEPAKKAEEPKAKPEPAKKPEPKKAEPAKKPEAKKPDAKKRAEDEIATVELQRGKPPELGDLLPTNEVDRGSVPAPRAPQLKRETTQSIVVDRPGQTTQQGGMSTTTIAVIVIAIVVASGVLLYKFLEKPEVVTLGDEPVAQSPVKKDDPAAPVNPPVEPATNPPTNPVADTPPAPNPAIDSAAKQADASLNKAAADALVAAAAPKVDPPAIEPPKVDPPKVDSPKVDPPKIDPPKVDPPKVDPPKVDPPKVDPPKTDTPAVVSKVELPKVDNKPAATGTKCPGGMALVKRKEGNVCVDQYEFPGKGQRPKTNVSWFDARKSCEAAGKRLCAASEWRAACGSKYPYGKAFDANKCNTQDEDGFERSLATGGSFGGCKSPSGAYDMTGNVHEWVEEKRIAGGAYDSDDGVATCGYSSPKAPASSGGSIGFRCCAAAE